MSARYRSRMSPSRMAEIDNMVASGAAPMSESRMAYIPLHMDTGFGALLMWFLLLTIASYVFLFNLQFSFTMAADGVTMDYQKVLMYSVIFALVIMLVLYFLCRM